MHINCWELIKKYLSNNSWRQKKLAEILKVTPPAISLFKKGENQLSPAQLCRIINILNFSERDRKEFYFRIAGARLQTEIFLSTLDGKERLPILRAEDLAEYVPALDRINEFVRDKSNDYLQFDHPVDADFALNIKNGTYLLVDILSTPVAGDVIIAIDWGGKCQLLTFGVVKRGRVYFSKDDRTNIIWHYKENPEAFRLVAKVVQYAEGAFFTPASSRRAPRQPRRRQASGQSLFVVPPD